MRRRLAGVALLGSMLAGCTSVEDPSADLAAIEELHRRDERLSKAKDYEGLVELCTDDFVLLRPGAPPVRGKAAMAAMHAEYERAMADEEILEYRFEFEEVLVHGAYAVEWGRMDGASIKDAERIESSFQLMRVLRKTPEGWKVHRAIYNAAPD